MYENSYKQKPFMREFEQNILCLYGEKGQQWLDNLPTIISQAQATYGLSTLRPVKNLSYNYVLLGLQNVQPIVLKLGLDIDGFKREASALKAFSGFGVVQVLAEKSGLFLLEGPVPGVSLETHFPDNDEEALHITANLIKRLHKAPRPQTRTFPHIKDWLSTLDKDWGIPAEYLQKARRLRDVLLKTSGEEVCLHGDLHQGNIVQHGLDWRAIDPKGALGEPAYEVAAFIRNPISKLQRHKKNLSIIHHRITRFSEIFAIPPQRIFDWCFVQAVLAWAWDLEDGDDNSDFKDLPKILSNINL